jgi:RNA polymerase sigma-70 factor (sigma-E family)
VELSALARSRVSAPVSNAPVSKPVSNAPVSNAPVSITAVDVRATAAAEGCPETDSCADTAAMDFDGYVQRRGRSLQRLAYLLCGDHHLAEDLTQAALAKAFTRWRRVCRARHPDAYVRQILVRTYLSHQRKRSAAELPTPSPGLPCVVAEDVAVDVVGRAAARALLADLPPRARAVLVLRYFADLDDAAIAEALGIQTSAVRSTASRALARLRQSVNVPRGERA